MAKLYIILIEKKSNSPGKIMETKQKKHKANSLLSVYWFPFLKGNLFPWHSCSRVFSSFTKNCLFYSLLMNKSQLFSWLLCNFLESCFFFLGYKAVVPAASEAFERGLARGKGTKTQTKCPSNFLPAWEPTSLTLLSCSQSLFGNLYLFFLISLFGDKSNFTSSPRNTFKVLLIFNMHNEDTSLFKKINLIVSDILLLFWTWHFGK